MFIGLLWEVGIMGCTAEEEQRRRGGQGVARSRGRDWFSCATTAAKALSVALAPFTHAVVLTCILRWARSPSWVVARP